MKTATMLLMTAIAGFALIGCGQPGPQTVDEQYTGKAAEELGKERREILLRAKGDFNAMTPEDKKTFLDGFKGDEELAKKYWNSMKNPPGAGAPSGMNQGR